MRKHPNYDFNRLKSALKSKASKLLAATSSNEYITQLDTVYNSGLADKSRKMNLIQFAKDREYEEDNVTEVMRFNLKDKEGDASFTEVFDRVKV